MSKRERKLRERVAILEADNRALQSLVATLVRQANPKETIETILGGITPLFLGYQDASKGQASRVQEIVTAMGSQGLDERAGVQDGTWYPDVEFDETMEAPNQWPTAGRVSSPTKTQVTTLNGSYRIENGQPVRNDGEAMFQTGATGPRPESATE